MGRRMGGQRGEDMEMRRKSHIRPIVLELKVSLS